MGIKDNTIDCLPVFQNQQEFLIGVFTISEILHFTKFTQRLIVGYDEDNMPIYNPQIQRFVENPRVQQIADFLIDDPNATFPTNLVLHIPSIIIEKQVQVSDHIKITLSREVFEQVNREKQKENSGDIFITIIDGQHRVRGIEVAISRLDDDIKLLNQTLLKNPTNADLKKRLLRYQSRKKDLLNIQLVVSFFVDKTLEYQAMIFSTINRTQKRVSDSLVSSLFGLTTQDSPQKTALQTVLILNSHEKSPFFGRVNLYGGDYDTNQSPPLSQATMVKSIVNLICENTREAERDRFKDRKLLLTRSSSSSKFLPLRRYYANDQDSKISDIFFYFFTAVRNTFIRDDGTSLWDFRPETMKPSNILQTTAGYNALLLILIDILKEMPESERFGSSNYEALLAAASHLRIENPERYPFTSKSRTILYLDINLAIWPAEAPEDSRLVKLRDALSK